ncbi:ATP-dependent helicase HrpB, partial [Brevibacterium paucivorans]
ASAQLFDLKQRWAPGPQALGVRGVEWGFLDHVARVAADEAHEVQHDILVFLPGRREITRVASALASLTDAEILTLMGSTPAREQRRITVTVGAAKDSMVQRAGRAARQGPGTVVRCMAEADFAARPAHAPAEITTADLTQAALDLACWGAPRGEGLALPTAPPEPALD